MARRILSQCLLASLIITMFTPVALVTYADHITFNTVATFPSGTEGLTGDAEGNLYTTGRSGTDCPVWRIRQADGATTQVGVVPGTCGPTGLAFDTQGRLLVLDGGRVWAFDARGTGTGPGVEVRSGAAGANGIAVHGSGLLFVSDGGTALGRIWRIGPEGAPEEAFRVPAMASDINVVDGVGGLGRDARALPQGAMRFTPTGRAPADSDGSIAIVANGIAFGPDGNLYVADTARGAIWVATLDAAGNITSPTGCDVAYSANTLCMESGLSVQHPLLEGADGLAIDVDGGLWVTSNERNAVVYVSPEGRVRDAFRNSPDPETRLRNTGPLEFPTSIHLDGGRLCVSQTDGTRRDNAPATLGELAPGSPLQGKVSCMSEAIPSPGLALPVR